MWIIQRACFSIFFIAQLQYITNRSYLEVLPKLGPDKSFNPEEKSCALLLVGRLPRDFEPGGGGLEAMEGTLCTCLILFAPMGGAPISKTTTGSSVSMSFRCEAPPASFQVDIYQLTEVCY